MSRIFVYFFGLSQTGKSSSINTIGNLNRNEQEKLKVGDYSGYSTTGSNGNPALSRQFDIGGT